MHHDGRAPLMNVEQLADELGVSVRYVRRIIAERRIPYVKVGHFIRFQRDDVERWVEANRVTAFTGRR
jgi:excisionase family DNA binding protein